MDRNQPKQSERTQFLLDSALPALDEDVFACQVQLIQFLFSAGSTARSNDEVYLLPISRPWLLIKFHAITVDSLNTWNFKLVQLEDQRRSSSSGGAGQNENR